MRLSACIITKDEERDLPACLASVVAFCDEVVVVDSGSSDRTRELAAEAGARVIKQPWLGFAAQRNVALDRATGDWVLEIDADERVSSVLRSEIEAFVSAAPTGVDLVGLPRREVLVGQALGASAKFPNYCHRLVRRGSHRHDEERTVHEGFVPDGPVHPLAGELVHLYAPTWRDAFDDLRSYARLEAEQMSALRTPSAVLRGLLVRPGAKLAYRLVVDGGWRDGPIGVARIALDCAADATVWVLYARRGPTGGGRSGVVGGAHYGSRRFPRGAPHVVALAIGGRAQQRGAAWAREAAASGLDVALLTPSAGVGTVRHRMLPTAGPLSAIRALDAEEQLRTLDGVVPFGRRASAWLRVAPEPVRGLASNLPEGIEPRELARRVQRAREALAA